MEREKPFLNDQLKLEELSNELGVNPRLLSQIINDRFNHNFFDFVNSYRINFAASMLQDSSCRKTVLEILFESGFNSKAPFYKAFKKFKNLTPTKFRQLNAKQ